MRCIIVVMNTDTEPTEAATVRVVLEPVDLGWQDLVEAIASMKAAGGPRHPRRRELTHALKDHIRQAGLNNLRAWRIGKSAQQIEEMLDEAYATVWGLYRDVYFPGEEHPAVLEEKRLEAWVGSLDFGQRRRYNMGRLEPFAEVGRRGPDARRGAGCG